MRSKCLVAVLIAGGTAAPLSAQSVKVGIEAWQKSDYAAAVAIWRSLADEGDADAAFNLGQAYRLGRGVPQDLAAAQGWFERAARKGNVDAQSMLGMMLFQTGNQTGGVRWLRMAAEKGEPRAMLIYGTALFNGDGLPRDPLLGYLYVTRSAETGLEQARMTLQRLDEILPAEDREKALQLSLPAPDRTSATPPAPQKKQPAQRSVKVATVAPAPKTAPKNIVTDAPKPDKRPAPVARGAWRIQLGAFSKRSSADVLFGRLSGKAALSGRNPYYIPAGAITRLQVGPFESQAAAQAACNALEPQPCFPVPAK